MAHCFAQLNKLNNGGRILYCSPSNKAVDVIGKFLKNHFFSDISRNSNEKDEFKFSFVRVYSDRISSNEYPNPKVFKNELLVSPRINQVKESYISSPSADSYCTDPELISFTLHHLVREDGKPYAEKLKKFDEKKVLFSS